MLNYTLFIRAKSPLRSIQMTVRGGFTVNLQAAIKSNDRMISRRHLTHELLLDYLEHIIFKILKDTLHNQVLVESMTFATSLFFLN